MIKGLSVFAAFFSLLAVSSASANTSGSTSNAIKISLLINSQTLTCKEDGTLVLDLPEIIEFTTLDHGEFVSLKKSTKGECERNLKFLLQDVQNPANQPPRNLIPVPQGVLHAFITTTDLPLNSDGTRRWYKTETIQLEVNYRVFTSTAEGICTDQCHLFPSVIRPGNFW